MKFLGIPIIFLIIIHIILPFISIFSPIPAAVYFIIFVYWIFRNKSLSYEIKVIYILSFCSSFELLGRLVRLSPFVPYEIGKYLAVFLALFQISRKRYIVNKFSVTLLMLSLPSLILVDFFNPQVRGTLIFNYFGFLALVLLSDIFNGLEISIKKEFKAILFLFILPLISILTQLFTINLDFNEFELGANYQQSGGFGPNQVSTILGAGLFLVFLFNKIYTELYFKIKIFNQKFSDSIFLFLITLYRSLLTFSRGGIFTGLGILIILILFQHLYHKSSTKIQSGIFSFLTFAIVGSAIFFYVNLKTDNLLYLRFTGETKATHANERDKDIDLILSGRLTLASNELELFEENLILGVGPGQSQLSRTSRGKEDASSHTEVTRMLAEHGILGLFMALIFLFYPIIETLKKPSSLSKLFSFCFFLFAIATSFHSSMRLIIVPLFYSFGFLKFVK